MAAASTTNPGLARLDVGGCLSLDQIIRSFNAPITEEHAFAIVYEAMKALAALLRDGNTKLSGARTTKEIRVNGDGNIDPATFLVERRRRKKKGKKKKMGKKKSEKGVSEAECLEGGSSTTTTATAAATTSAEKIISQFGEIIFTALDYGVRENEERKLTPGLANLLNLMTSMAEDSSSTSSSSSDGGGSSSSEDDDATAAGPSDPQGAAAASPRRPHLGDTDDEGIEKDHDEDDESSSNGSSSLPPSKPDPCAATSAVLDLCAHHLAVPSEADGHFRAVCRALVSETIELSTFLQKAKDSEKYADNEELQELALQDWANLWIQTIHELRQGVKLKKTSFTKTPIEYELTPYEILMDDIRSRRYKLNKVMVDGELPHRVKKDAHDIILDFIRSRPPLKSASLRQLAPRQRYSTPAELLMDSIRGEAAREALKKTEGPPEPKSSVIVETSDSSVVSVPLSSIIEDLPNGSGNPVKPPRKSASSLLRRTDSVKKIIKPDPRFLAFDPDEEEDELFEHATTLSPAKSLPSFHDSHVSIAKEDKTKHRTIVTINGEECKSSSNQREQQQQQASSVTLRRKRVQWNVGSSLDEKQSSPISRRRHSAMLPSSGEPSPTATPPVSSRNQLLLQSEQWASALQALDLSLEEVVHIRKVLTKAELEGLTLDADLRADLERGKVCFLCMKTRFGIFAWSYLCQLCKHTVCSGCLTKMRLPSDQFSEIPVYALSPPSPTSWRQTAAGGSAGESSPQSQSSGGGRGGIFRRRSMSARRRRESSSCSDEEDAVNHNNQHQLRNNRGEGYLSRPRSVSIVDISSRQTSSPSSSSLSFGGIFGSASSRSRATASRRRTSATEEEEDEEEEESSLDVGRGAAVTKRTSTAGSFFRSLRGGGQQATQQRASNNKEDVTPKSSRTVKLRRSNTTISSGSKMRPRSASVPQSPPNVESGGGNSGTQVNVCLDCKEMILQIIRAQRASRRQQFTRSLCLTE